MQYVRNLSDSVSTAWNSINPATLSGAIDVIVVEGEDGTLACSPFHVRFGKFSLLRPYEKKVEFKVNGVKQDYSMKLGEGGEAFFVFETTDRIPQSLQTSPLVSPAASPPLHATQAAQAGLGEPELLELEKHRERQQELGDKEKDEETDGQGQQQRQHPPKRPPNAVILSSSAPRDDVLLTPRSTSPDDLAVRFPGARVRPKSGDWAGTFAKQSYGDDIFAHPAQVPDIEVGGDAAAEESLAVSDRSHSPPPLAPREALDRAMVLSRELSAVNIPSHVTDTGDLMLDMTGFQSKEEDVFRAEILARKILSEELDGNYDIGALIGLDERGNLWIYSSEDAKAEAMKRTMESSLRPTPAIAGDAASDPGYQSDGSDVTTTAPPPLHRRSESDVGHMEIHTPPTTPPRTSPIGDPNRNYAKTLRLTSDQLKALNLSPGQNSMSFTVNRATCQANMYLWRHETPVVISDIDGTITKSDALGHVLNMIGRDWTHSGVAKLYSDIAANGYNIMYLTSRSVGQADTTRTYLANIVQDGCRLPRGPTILSPDRTFSALRREIYLRQPQVFKMATLRDIRILYGTDHKSFYAGFGNRLTDQISYRTVDVPRNRIFTINSNAEVSLDLLSLNTLKMSYVNINEVVDHYFPPVSMLVTGGGEDFTDFTYWRKPVLELDDFTDSESEENEKGEEEEEEVEQYADDEDEDEVGDGMMDSYISRESYGEASILSGEQPEEMTSSMMEDLEEEDEEQGEVEEDEEIEDEVAELEKQAEVITQRVDAKTAVSEPPTKETKEAEAEAEKEKKAHVLVEDVGAELITGVSHLTRERDVDEADDAKDS
jgi:phosphatidate phosphatase LPIN